MIIKIVKLKNIGKFSELKQERDFLSEKSNGDTEKSKCSIIFGFNGSGKTTLSNAISFFANNSFISEEEKKEIFEDVKNEDAVVKLKLQGKGELEYCGKDTAYNEPIYVFNSHFVATHVFDGTKGNLKNFSNADSAEIKSDALNKIDEEIAKLKMEEEKLNGKNEDLDKLVKGITEKYSSDFKNLAGREKHLIAPKLTTETLPTETLDSLNQTLEKLKLDYDFSKKSEDLHNDLSAINNLNFQKCEIDLEKINQTLNKNIQQLSKEVMGNKIEDVKNSFVDEEYKAYKKSTEKWFRFGKSVLDSAKKHGGQTKCPICDTDISARLDDILQNFNGYFDKGYEDFIEKLTGYKKQVQGAMDLMDDIGKLKQLGEKYKAQITEKTFEDFDFKSTKLELKNVLEACDSKLADIQFSFSISQPTIDALSNWNTSIGKFDTLKNTLQKTLSGNKLNEKKVEQEIRKTYEGIILLEFDQSDEGGNVGKYMQNKDRLKTIHTRDSENKKGLPFYTNQRGKELRKLKLESRGISKYLEIMGIEHFTINIDEKNKNENVVINFKSGPEKHTLKNCISDGEKTALAFAYFLSKFENECEENKRKESVVVIDDPISSLDENRLYSTAHLINDNFKDGQLIVLSHNFLFLKFFNAACNNANCLFLDGDKLTKLPEEFRSFESPYFYMLNSVIEFSKSTNAEQNAEKYIPNYVRRVLETFLSFKFAKIADKNGRSPGLGDFDIDNLEMEDSTKKDLKEKIKRIKRITDKSSHGSAHLTEEMTPPKENLKKLALDTVGVIEILDSAHIHHVQKLNATKDGIKT
jgi:wobble nucleotide-excising tRNase